MRVTNYSETQLKCVWEQRQYDAPLAGRQARQGRERQPSIAARTIWKALYIAIALGKCMVASPTFGRFYTGKSLGPVWTRSDENLHPSDTRKRTRAKRLVARAVWPNYL